MTDDRSTDPSLATDSDLPGIEPTRMQPLGGDLPSEAVVRTVADALDRDPLDLPPLHEVVDPDALDDLFVETKSGGSRHGNFSFEYCGCTVALLGSEAVAVDPSD